MIVKNLKYWLLLCVCLNHLSVYSASAAGAGAPVSAGAADVALSWDDATRREKALFERLYVAIIADDTASLEGIKTEVGDPIKLTQIINMSGFPPLYGSYLLLKAVSLSGVDVVRWLINNGADYRQRGSGRDTVLHSAAFGFNHHVLEYLLREVVPLQTLTEVNVDGFTPLVAILGNIKYDNSYTVAENISRLIETEVVKVLRRYEGLLGVDTAALFDFNDVEGSDYGEPDSSVVSIDSASDSDAYSDEDTSIPLVHKRQRTDSH